MNTPPATSSPRAQHVPPLGSAPYIMLEGERRALYEEYKLWALQRGQEYGEHGYPRWLEQRVWELERSGK